jgi:hypothetical protein
VEARVVGERDVVDRDDRPRPDEPRVDIVQEVEHARAAGQVLGADAEPLEPGQRAARDRQAVQARPRLDLVAARGARQGMPEQVHLDVVPPCERARELPRRPRDPPWLEQRGAIVEGYAEWRHGAAAAVRASEPPRRGLHGPIASWRRLGRGALGARRMALTATWPIWVTRTTSGTEASTHARLRTSVPGLVRRLSFCVVLRLPFPTRNPSLAPPGPLAALPRRARGAAARCRPYLSLTQVVARGSQFDYPGAPTSP